MILYKYFRFVIALQEKNTATENEKGKLWPLYLKVYIYFDIDEFGYEYVPSSSSHTLIPRAVFEAIVHNGCITFR